MRPIQKIQPRHLKPFFEYLDEERTTMEERIDQIVIEKFDKLIDREQPISNNIKDLNQKIEDLQNQINNIKIKKRKIKRAEKFEVFNEKMLGIYDQKIQLKDHTKSEDIKIKNGKNVKKHDQNLDYLEATNNEGDSEPKIIKKSNFNQTNMIEKNKVRKDLKNLIKFLKKNKKDKKEEKNSEIDEVYNEIKNLMKKYK